VVVGVVVCACVSDQEASQPLLTVYALNRTTAAMRRRCSLGLLVRKVNEQNAVAAIQDLSSKVVGAKKESTRDIASIALKTVIAEVRYRDLRSCDLGCCDLGS